MKAIYWLLLVAMLSISCGSKPTTVEDVSTPKEPEWKTGQREIINKFLTKLQKGENADFLYCLSTDSFFLTDLYTVQKWEIVNEPNENKSSGGIFTVRIDSSTKAGSPITKLYKFEMSGKTVAGVDVYCILDMKEK